MSSQIFEFQSIAVYTSKKIYSYDAGRQSREDSDEEGVITFAEGFNFEQALEDLKGFDRLWLIFVFDRNSTWSAKVFPPRGSATKKSVFATRSPYRPNPIGLSCVRILEVSGRAIKVQGADLLNGTPILDIKPYLAYADSFPSSRMGWLEGVENFRFKIELSDLAKEQLEFLKTNNFASLEDFIFQQLEYEPLDERRKRVEVVSSSDSNNSDGSIHAVLSYRTFRIAFTVSEYAILVQRIFSGYSIDELNSLEDKYQDKAVHRELQARGWRAMG